ncbi:hypothetical protein D3C87_923280 [compost metagenome]
MPADAGFGAIVVQVGKIRCLVAGGSIFKPGAIFEAFAGTAEILPGLPATSYPIYSYSGGSLTLGPGGDLSFTATNGNQGLFFNVSTTGIVSDVGKIWSSTAGYGEGAPLSLTGIRYQDVLARDPQGNLILAGQQAIYMVPATNGTYYGKAMLAGHVYVIVGRTSAGGSHGDVNVPATDVPIQIGHIAPAQIAVDAQGNLFFGDNLGMGRLRMVPRASGTYYGQVMTANHIYTLSSEALSNPTYVMNVGIDGAGNVYFVRGLSSGNPLRKIAPDGTVMDPAPGFSSAAYLAVAGDGTLYAARDRVIWKIAGGVATILMNAASGNSEDGTPLAQAQITSTFGLIASSEGHFYFLDTANRCVRMIPKTDGTYHGKAMLANHLYVVAGTRSLNSPDGSPRAQTIWTNLNDLKLDRHGNVYALNSSSNAVTMIPAVSGTYFGKAMTAGHAYNLDMGTDNSSPKHLALLPNGEIYFYTPENVPYVGTRYFVRKIALDGSISDVLMETSGFSIATDPVGNLYLLTTHRVEMIPAANGTYFGQVMTAGTRYTVAGNGTSGAATGIATGATLQGPGWITFDASGNLYVHMTGNNQIRMVPNVAGTYFGQAMTAGHIYGLPIYGYYPVCDSLGNLYVRQLVQWKISKLSTNGQLSDFAGGGSGGAGTLAKIADLSSIGSLTFGPDGALYMIQSKYQLSPQIMRIL